MSRGRPAKQCPRGTFVFLDGSLAGEDKRKLHCAVPDCSETFQLRDSEAAVSAHFQQSHAGLERPLASAPGSTAAAKQNTAKLAKAPQSCAPGEAAAGGADAAPAQSASAAGAPPQARPSTIAIALRAAQRQAAKKEVVKAQLHGALPRTVLKNRFLLCAFQKYDPEFSAPSRGFIETTTSEVVLSHQEALIKALQTGRLPKLAPDGVPIRPPVYLPAFVSFAADSWSMGDKKLLAVLAIVRGEPFIATLVDASDLSLNGDTLRTVFLSTAARLSRLSSGLEVEICSVVTDNAQACLNGMEAYAASQQVVAVGCCAHAINLVARRILDAPVFGTLMAQARALVNFVNSNKALKAVYNSERGTSLSAMCATRWTSAFSTTNSLAQNRAALALLKTRIDTTQPAPRLPSGQELAQAQRPELQGPRNTFGGLSGNLEADVKRLDPVERLANWLQVASNRAAVPATFDILTAEWWGSLDLLNRVLRALVATIAICEADRTTLADAYLAFHRLHFELASSPLTSPLIAPLHEVWEKFLHHPAFKVAAALDPEIVKAGRAPDLTESAPLVNAFHNLFPGNDMLMADRRVNLIGELRGFIAQVESGPSNFPPARDYWSQSFVRKDYPFLSGIAIRLFSISVSSAPVERLWSVARRIYTWLRRSMNTSTLIAQLIGGWELRNRVERPLDARASLRSFLLSEEAPTPALQHAVTQWQELLEGSTKRKAPTLRQLPQRRARRAAISASSSSSNSSDSSSDSSSEEAVAISSSGSDSDSDSGEDVSDEGGAGRGAGAGRGGGGRGSAGRGRGGRGGRGAGAQAAVESLATPLDLGDCVRITKEQAILEDAESRNARIAKANRDDAAFAAVYAAMGSRGGGEAAAATPAESAATASSRPSPSEAQGPPGPAVGLRVTMHADMVSGK